MDDILQRVTGEHDFFKNILEKVPGFKGYVEREDRRAADKLLRENVADEFERLWGRISALQREVISNGELDKIDDLESASLKLRQFIDRVRTASYGYAGFFDAIKVNTEELDEIYKYDAQLLELGTQLSNAIDNVEASFGTDGQPAAIRHLVTLSQDSVDAFDRRGQIIVNMSANTAA
jgi:hypothetical protein